MVDKYTVLLRKQIEKLNKEEFDLNAWKSSSLALLRKIFHPKDPLLSELDSIKIEYGSSWSMRDADGSYNPILSSKRRGKEILEMAIDELEHFGIDHQRNIVILEALENNLKSTDYKTIKDLMLSDQRADEKQRVLDKILASLDKKALSQIISEIIINS